MPWYARLSRGFEVLWFSLLLAVLLTGDAQLVSQDTAERARRYTLPIEFDYVEWTVNAFEVKLTQASLNTPFYLSEYNRRLVVRDYLKITTQILRGEYELSMLYSDPAVHDPEAASTELRAKLDGLYDHQRSVAPLAEAILEEQVSTVLAEMDLTSGGQPIPPVLFHLSPMPYQLIVSPRDRIQKDASISLLPDLTVDRQAALETEVDSGLNVSSLVVPLGGLGSYPTMIERTTIFDWLVNTIAHEWTHNWLTLRPLGMNYETLVTMNETTASIAGNEIGRAVFERYYPDLLAESTPGYMNISLDMPGLPRQQIDERHELYLTRVHVDELLAQDKVEEAEAYMEQRRQFLWENGSYYRKINQAFFAFHGAYADVPGGAAGEDPVGPAVRLLRERSRSLADFLQTIAKMTSFEDLQNAISQ